MVGMCFDIDSAEISDSIIVERSLRHRLSVASAICDFEDDEIGRSPGMRELVGAINYRIAWGLK